MNTNSPVNWHPRLADPSASRTSKPRTTGQTMVMDKGMGQYAFSDLLDTAANYIDFVKIGFGTSPLYPSSLLQRKIAMAKERGVYIYPGGTFLEIAVAHGEVDAYFSTIKQLGYNGIEVSDGTIELSRVLRDELIARALDHQLIVVTEYGKKMSGSSIDVEQGMECIALDVESGASLVIIEARESGVGVGIFDEQGQFRDEQTIHALAQLPHTDRIMWEAPQKSQQVELIRLLGANIHIGNIAPQDIISLEALRRGLRSDTFILQ